MLNFFDSNIIPMILSRFKVERVLVIGLSNKLIMDEILSFYLNNKCSLYTIDSRIDINKLIKEYNIKKDQNNENIKHFNDNGLSILPELKNINAIFINDDPNWYTTYNELNLIKNNNSKFPLVFISNNKYPHKRRDSYINPDKIPKQYINEYDNDLKIQKENKEYISINDGLYHAKKENTPKNGVLTAIDDFLKENPYLTIMEINPFEGIYLIYESTKNTENILKEINAEKIEYNNETYNLINKIQENNHILEYISKMNSLKDDLDKIDKIKRENNNYENEIRLLNSKIKYKDSKIDNIKSQINLKETTLKNEQLKILKKSDEIKNKDDELLEKEKELETIKNRLIILENSFLEKNKEIECMNNKLIKKEKELETVKNRLINLETSFLDKDKELNYVKKQLSETNPNNLTEIQEKINEKNAIIKSKNQRINRLNKKLSLISQNNNETERSVIEKIIQKGKNYTK